MDISVRRSALGIRYSRQFHRTCHAMRLLVQHMGIDLRLEFRVDSLLTEYNPQHCMCIANLPTINEAIELLSRKYPTAGKPILLGFSGGGMMAYYQAVKHGNSYSYIFPVSGNLSKKLLGDTSSRRGAKVFAFHGKTDSVVPISGGKKAVNILRRNGLSVSFVEFDGGHQGIFADMKSKIIQAIEQKLAGLK